MAPQKDPISVRSTRLDNLIVGKHPASTGAIQKATASSGRRSILPGGGAGAAIVSAACLGAINREALLDALILLFGECDKDAMKKRDRNIAEFVNKYRPIIDETRQLRVNADDFTVKTLIGKGYFGNVHLVVERHTGDVYAMKKIQKSVVTTSQMREERDIMARRSSEWITNLQYAFQDSESLYLVMEYLPGGDLLGLMSRHGPFDEDLARFYLAELTLAIHSLHAMGYVHRDIKPENILIDRFGHIKLADFGNAAAMDRDGHVLSLSPVGTPDYIAPELLQTISMYKPTKSTHDVSCDYWSMGIIGYELICEITPFHEDNVHATYSKILSHCEESHLQEIITFPSDLKISTNFKNLIEALLTNPTNRLGYEKIRSHPYFETVEWDTLRSKVPPIIPTVIGEEDTSNFGDVAATTRNKGRTTFTKKPAPPTTTQLKSNDFSGKDLPYLGYSFVHMAARPSGGTVVEDCVQHEARINKLNTQIKELQIKLKERLEEVNRMKQDLSRAEQIAKQSDIRTKVLQDAKEEILKMKDVIKEKTCQLAACRTQIKTMQSSIKVDEEMWQKKESTITELLRVNRQKYEEAKTASEQRYEKSIAEKKNEVIAITQKLETRESELLAKTEECHHLQEKMLNYKEMLRQFKEQAHADRLDFEKNKTQLSERYENTLQELRSKLQQEKASRSRLTMELRDVRTELDDTICTSKSSLEARNATEKNNEEFLKRLNSEIKANNELTAKNTNLEQELTNMRRTLQEAQQEIGRLEREMQVTECGKTLAESVLNNMETYETAPGSLTELHAMEEQLRSDLEAAIEKEVAQKERADKLQEIVAKMEEMLERFNEQSMSPTKAPHSGTNSDVGDMLERQNEKLEDKLAAVREQMIVERQAARTANLALWKVEKQLEECLAEKKMTQRRMELTEERIKKTQAERDDIQRQLKSVQAETVQRDERIQELKQEMAELKRDVQKEHRQWEKAEQERMKCKSEIIEHISNVHRLQERLVEIRDKLHQSQQRCDSLSLENKRLITQLNEERERCGIANDSLNATQLQHQQLEDNYERLKYACTITDKQLTEVEGMLEAEQKRNEAHQAKIEKLRSSGRQKDEIIIQLNKELNDERAQRRGAEVRINTLANEINEQKANLKAVQTKLISQHDQLVEQTNNLFETQETVEVLTTETSELRTLYENNEREMAMLKEENARILSDLFHAKEQVYRLQQELAAAQSMGDDLRSESDHLQADMAEKENFYLQRDIKSEATLAQHKKLIDYLQLKVEDLSQQQKKKKTLADMLFGTVSGSSNNNNYSSNYPASAKKENISPNAVESSILYRALREELRREQQRVKTLQDQLDKTIGMTSVSNFNSSVRKQPPKHFNTDIVKAIDKNTEPSAPPASENTTSKTNIRSPRKSNGRSPHKSPRRSSLKATIEEPTAKVTGRHHRFELALQETNMNNIKCLACQQPLIAGAPFWQCRDCSAKAHRKCRGDVKIACEGCAGIISTHDSGGHDEVGMLKMPQTSTPIEEEKLLVVGSGNTLNDAQSNADSISLGKYSYEGRLDTVDGCNEGPSSLNNMNVAKTGTVAKKSRQDGATLVFSVDTGGESPHSLPVEVNCAYEIEERRILLLGCNTGLYAYNWPEQRLVHIVGIESVSYIAISQSLSKAIMVGSAGESLYQCDYRQLLTRCQTNTGASAAIKPTALEASVLDLPFANRVASEKWQLVSISNETENAIDSVAIAATSTRIVILKYDVKLQKFKPVRALDTATPVTAILFTRHTAIVSSDKFFEIDLETYAAEEFIDNSDQSLSHTSTCQPTVAIRITPQEFLLCFMECGVFVDEFGHRTRPFDVNWEYTPTGFIYREPFLFVAHFQYVQIIQLHRIKENDAPKNFSIVDNSAIGDAERNRISEIIHRRVFLPMYMPTLLSDSGKVNMYALAIDRNTGLQEIHHLDAIHAHKQKFTESVETISSLGTLATSTSITVADVHETP